MNKCTCKYLHKTLFWSQIALPSADLQLFCCRKTNRLMWAAVDNTGQLECLHAQHLMLFKNRGRSSHTTSSPMLFFRQLRSDRKSAYIIYTSIWTNSPWDVQTKANLKYDDWELKVPFQKCFGKSSSTILPVCVGNLIRDGNIGKCWWRSQIGIKHPKVKN